MFTISHSRALTYTHTHTRFNYIRTYLTRGCTNLAYAMFHRPQTIHPFGTSWRQQSPPAGDGLRSLEDPKFHANLAADNGRGSCWAERESRCEMTGEGVDDRT